MSVGKTSLGRGIKSSRWMTSALMTTAAVKIVDSLPQSGRGQSPAWSNPHQSLFSSPRSTV